MLDHRVWGYDVMEMMCLALSLRVLNMMDPQAHLTPRGVGDGLWSSFVSHLNEDDSDILARVGL